MYYVKKGNHKGSYFIARGPKFDDSASVGRLNEYDLLYYDYDDENAYSLSDLRRRLGALSKAGGNDYDPAEMAVQGELDRRAGEMAPPWFDTFTEMMEDLNQAVEEEDIFFDFEDDKRDDQKKANNSSVDVMDMLNQLISDRNGEAKIESPYSQKLIESTENFLAEKGFDLTTLVGMKKAQKWLERAAAENTFRPKGETDSETDRPLGKARTSAMLKIVRAKIDERLKM